MLRLGTAIDTALEDGDIDLFDVSALFDPLVAAKAAFEGSKLIPAEIGDLSEIEASELTELTKAELEIRNEKAERITEKAVAVMTQLIALVNEIRN